MKVEMMSKIVGCPNCNVQRLGGSGGTSWCLNPDCAFLWTDVDMIDFEHEEELA